MFKTNQISKILPQGSDNPNVGGTVGGGGGQVAGTGVVQAGQISGFSVVHSIHAGQIVGASNVHGGQDISVALFWLFGCWHGGLVESTLKMLRRISIKHGEEVPLIWAIETRFKEIS